MSLEPLPENVTVIEAKKPLPSDHLEVIVEIIRLCRPYVGLVSLLYKDDKTPLLIISTRSLFGHMPIFSAYWDHFLLIRFEFAQIYLSMNCLATRAILLLYTRVSYLLLSPLEICYFLQASSDLQNLKSTHSVYIHVIIIIYTYC